MYCSEARSFCGEDTERDPEREEQQDGPLRKWEREGKRTGESVIA